eukprot:TRINITY_DN2865_c0_g1_i1.p1 TRINITY_DN2865_c0_g1~~TRINITY_DN2865_c0_g1_i1.p1  ORF type:complete len:466 (-),score=134.33 TRINITY_DN2865_c0_g1_i1:1368-2765(-)
MGRGLLGSALLLVLSLSLVLHSSRALPNPFEKYKQTVDTIISAARNNTVGYDRLAEMCDTFGSRLSGSDALEEALDWIASTMRTDGLDGVTEQPVLVPKWVRGSESLEMVLPRHKKMNMLGLGGSISTPPGGITADVIVVESFEELISRSNEVQGKIVVYNVPFGTYGGTVVYRSEGAAEAAKFGAVASLTRSITPYSLNSPHTGSMSYASGVTKIPAAAITVEDAEMLARMQKRGQTVSLHLEMEARTEDDSWSRNVWGEIRGTEKPEEVVVIGGHIDSWDVGSGAHDDGGGCLISWEAVRLLKELGLRPRRTIRAVFFTNEENGQRGAAAYRDALSQEQLNNTVMAMESDGGTFKPIGLSFDGTLVAEKTVQLIANLLAPEITINVTAGSGGADVSPLARGGVPAAGLKVEQYYTEQDMYFWYHHTNADTPDHIDPADFNECLAAWASVAFVVADMEQNLPRK